MIVLSLFDGISCGQVALNRLGIKIDKYYASEICDYSIKITKHNFPNTIEIGDVRDINGKDYKNVDLLIGGSPCQSFSFAGSGIGMVTQEKKEVTNLKQYLKLKEKGFKFEGYSYLFWEYVRILKEVKPKYFLLENVKMAKKWEKVITDALEVEPILLDSSLVSAQTRERLYWTNIPNFKKPEDKNIYIEDILQEDIEHKYLPTTRLDYNNYDKSKVDKSIHKYTATQIGNSRNFGNSIRNNGKAFTLRRIEPNGIIDENYRIRRFTPIEAERLQTLPDNYTLVDGIYDSQRYEALGNCWTVDIIVSLLKGIKV